MTSSCNRRPLPDDPPPGGGPISAAGRFLFYWLPLIALCTAIFWQSSFASFQAASLFSHQDKLLHITAYGLMAFLAARALSRERPQMGKFGICIVSMGFTILFGLSDEIHQAFVPGRFASIGDWIADILGSGIGAGIYIKRK